MSLVFANAHAGKGKVRVGDPLPELTWISVDGDSLSWSVLCEDGPLVMVFWATWCAVCKKHWPELKKLGERYSDSDIPPTWAAVGLGEDPDKVARVASDRKLPGWIIADPDEKNGELLGIEFVPTVCVLDATGRLVYIGPPKIGSLDNVLKDLTSSNEKDLQ